MYRYSPLLFILVIFWSSTSCNQKNASSFKVEGIITGLANEPILLETLSFPNMNGNPLFTTIDTITTGDDGSFTLSGMLRERSICRIKAINNPAYYLLLNLHDEKVKIEADVNSTDPKITGSPATLVLAGFIGTLRAKNNEIVEFNQQVLTQRAALGDSLYFLMEQRRDGMIDAYFDYITEFADTTTETTNKIVALENLYFEAHFDMIKEHSMPIIQQADTSSIYVRELADKIKRYEAIMVEEEASSFTGKPAIDIALPDKSGRILTMSSIKNQVVLLDFWASWCGPCRQENPNLVKVYQEFKDQGFTIYSVSLDKDQAAWLKAIQTDGLMWPYHVNEQPNAATNVASSYRITSIPASFLIDRDGMIIAQNLRGPALREAVAAALK